MNGAADRPGSYEPEVGSGIARRVRASLPAVALAAAGLVAATIGAWFLESPSIGIADASLVYLVAVALVAVRYGTIPALATAVGSFLLFDFLFVEPRFTFAVGTPREWLDLLLLLFVAFVVGRLAAAAAERADDAERRARESVALFGVSRTLAESTSTADAAGAVLRDLAAETRMRRLVLVRLVGAREVVVADTDAGAPRPSLSVVATLDRRAGDAAARWIRSHEPGPDGARGAAATRDALYRVRVEAGGATAGWIVGLRPRDAGSPGLAESRLLALAADQLGLGFRRDSLAAAATEAEVARRSEAAKSSLLDSVSHDLRTPLSSIRAAAGGLLDPEITWSADAARAAAATIDLEAQRLDRLVRNVLDLGRIEGGSIRPTIEVFDAVDLVRPVVDRLRPVLGSSVEVEVDASTPLVAVDASLFDLALSNLLENVARHAPGARARVTVAPAREGRALVVVEDDGPGVPPDAMPRLFDKFYRVPRRGEGSRRGLGVGLAIARGLVEAMEGSVTAAASPLGGLAVSMELPGAPPPDEDGGS